MRFYIRVLILVVFLPACDFNDTFFLTEQQDPITKPKVGEEFSFTSSDNTEIHGLLLRSEAEPKATFYLFHGSGENIYSWEELAEPLVAAQFDVVMMDYRGFGHSGGRPTHDNAVSDASELVTFIEDQIRSDIRILLGHSYGGQVAIHLASDFQGYFDGLITEGTFTNHREEAIASVPTWLKPIVALIAISRYRADDLIEVVTIPKLIIHSRDDKIVPPWMGERLYERAKDRKVYWEIGGTHALGLLETTKDYIEKVEDFVASLSNSGPN